MHEPPHTQPHETEAQTSEGTSCPPPKTPMVPKKSRGRNTRKTLIQRVQQEGDRASWEDFYQTYQGFIISISMKNGLNSHDAEDLMSRVFEEVHRKFSSDTQLDFSDQSFGGWLGTLVKWRIKDFYRKKQKTADVLDDDILIQLNPDKPFDQIWDKEWQQKLLQMALTRVKESPRNLLIFTDLAIKDHPVATVYERYDVSRSNADTIKNRVLKKLAPIVKELNQGVL